MPDIQKSCFRGFIGFWFFCLVFCSLLPGFSAAGSIFYKSVCGLFGLCAVCAVRWKFNVGVCGGLTIFNNLERIYEGVGGS